MPRIARTPRNSRTLASRHLARDFVVGVAPLRRPIRIPFTVAGYDMIAIDLDGTLLDSRGELSRPCAEAIADARDAGVFVTICTGRGLPECAPILKALCHADPVVVAGGSIIACPATRRTLHRFAIAELLVRDAVAHMNGQGYPVMVLKDPCEAGFDYLMVIGEDEHPLDPVSLWWFEHMDVSVRTVRTLEEDEHPDHTVRLGVCALNHKLDPLLGAMQGVFADRAVMHHFPAVVAPEHATQWTNGEAAHILEIFAAEATKWSAIKRIAGERAIAVPRIAAIGDQINDLSMIENAGLGVAMGNAVPSVKAAAKRETRTNDESGVAHAIRRILDGEW